MATVFHTATSLDGFLADPDHALDWLFQFDPPAPGRFETFLAGVGAIAMGSSTYAWVLRHQVPDPDASAEGWPYAVPTWVFSSRALPAVAGADVRVVRGDVAPHLDAMQAAAGDRDVWIVGGGDLAGQVYDAGRLDRIVVTVASVTLGAGAPLFPRRIHPPLRLRAAEAFPPGFVELSYDVPPPATAPR